MSIRIFWIAIALRSYGNARDRVVVQKRRTIGCESTASPRWSSKAVMQSAALFRDGKWCMSVWRSGGGGRYMAVLVVDSIPQSQVLGERMP